jgi:hypothetical protein
VCPSVGANTFGIRDVFIIGAVVSNVIILSEGRAMGFWTGDRREAESCRHPRRNTQCYLSEAWTCCGFLIQCPRSEIRNDRYHT